MARPVDIPPAAWRALLRLVAALVVLASGIARSEDMLVVHRASIETRKRFWGADTRSETAWLADFEFEEPRLSDLRDDEADMELAIIDGRGRELRQDVSDLESCQMVGDGGMRCPGGPTFQRVAGAAARWRVVLAFTRGARAGDVGARGPLTVRFTYAFAGVRRAQVGVLPRCVAASRHAKLVCAARAGSRGTMAP